MNKDNPTPIASQDPIAKANDKLMEAIAKDLQNTKDKSVSELIYGTGGPNPEEPQSWWDWFFGKPKKPLFPPSGA